MKNNNIIAKLTAFDENRRENPYYKSEARANEKRKGVGMVSYLKNLFSINPSDERRHQLEMQREQQRKRVEGFRQRNKIRWHRDEKGNIMSPWSKRIKREEEQEQEKKDL